MKNNSGFTLVELVAVMVILAILAVVAVPQFLDLRVQAANATASGVGGSIASASALNYSKGVTGAGAAVLVNACTGTLLAPLIGLTGTATTITVSGRIYNIASVTAPTVSGGYGTCTIEDQAPAAATPQSFTVIGCTPVTTC